MSEMKTLKFPGDADPREIVDAKAREDISKLSNQTAQQVGADPAGTAASAVSQHNTDATSHNDLRLALQELSDRINAALDSDDTTLDQMSEVVAYIKSNKSLIDAITTSKVNVSDIVNNLTTDISNKPLSAAQGVALKELINALSNSMTAYRTAAAQDVIDSGKVDKVTGKGLSSNDYTDAAKAKVDALAPVATSGNYDDLTNKPTIPAPVTEQTVSGWGFTKNTGAGGSSVPKPLTYDYMPDGYPKKSVLFDIEWDGDTSGLVSVAGAFYKVADYTAVTKADLVGCMLSIQNDPEHPEPFAVEEDDINDTIIPHAIMVSDYAIFVSEPTSYGPYNFTEPGIYMSKNREIYTARLVKQTITTIAEEFLPAIAKNTTVFHSDFGTLKHDDGTLVTAQEAYDAFMNTRVLIMRIDRIYQAISMLWYDNNSAQTDPTNVGYVQLAYVFDSAGTITLITEEAGNSSLIPG